LRSLTFSSTCIVALMAIALLNLDPVNCGVED
jgi:hypothetical protein